MQMALIISTLLLIGIYATLCYNNVSEYSLLMGLAFNTILLLRIFLGFGLKYTVTRFLRGEILPLYLYLLWLYIYPQDEHLYKIPILLSCIGKVYLLCSNPQGLWIDAVENLIMLQSHCQLFLALYHLLKLCIVRKTNLTESAFQFILLVMILKIKFQIHYGTRKSYESMHFMLDRCAKNLKIRPFYHFFQRLASNLAGDWHHSKAITY